MADFRLLVFGYVRDAWRRRWQAIGAAWVVCAAGWMLVAEIPDYFESSARVYMASDETLTPLLQGIALDSDIDTRLDRLQRTLLSVTNMKKLIQMTDLDTRVHDDADRDALTAALQKSIKVKPETRNLFTISYDDPDPAVAESVVSSLLSIFMESTAGDTRADINSAQRFLQSEIDRLEAALREDERRKAEFQSRYYDLLPDPQSGLSQLEQTGAEVQQATQDLDDAIAERDSIQHQRDSTPRFDSGPPPPMPTKSGGLSVSPRTRLAQLQAQLDMARATMTDLHPVVIALRHQIALAAADVAKLPAQERAGPAPGSVENSIYQDLTIRLAEQDSAVASLRRRLAAAAEDRDRLEDETRKAPSVAAEFANLDRDYGILKKTYEELLARRESARIAENADDRGDKIVVRTIDPPDTPVLPAGPNRPLYLSLVLVAGLGAGVGVAVVLSRIDSSFSTTTALRELGLPVLGSISRTEIPGAGRPRRLKRVETFASACVMLIVLYGALLAHFMAELHTEI
jgi:polysaccharide chain length determinant protein (PEP-CTERM system associated)